MAVDLYAGYYVFVLPGVDSVEPVWLEGLWRIHNLILLQSTFMRFWCNGTYHAERHKTCDDCTQGRA